MSVCMSVCLYVCMYIQIFELMVLHFAAEKAVETDSTEQDCRKHIFQQQGFKRCTGRTNHMVLGILEAVPQSSVSKGQIGFLGLCMVNKTLARNRF